MNQQLKQKELMKLSLQTLKKKCKLLRLSTEGGKINLIERIIYKQYGIKMQIQTFINKPRTDIKTIDDYLLCDTNKNKVKKIKIWCESITGQSWAHNALQMFEILRNASYLCKLINFIRPNTIKHIKDTDPKMNAKSFIDACTLLKVPSNECIHKIHDLVDINDMKYDLIINNLYALSTISTAKYQCYGVHSKYVKNEYYMALWRYFNNEQQLFMNITDWRFRQSYKSSNLDKKVLKALLKYINGSNVIMDQNRFIIFLKYISLIQNALIDINKIDLTQKRDFISIHYTLIDLDKLKLPFKLHEYKVSTKLSVQEFKNEIKERHCAHTVENELLSVCNLSNYDIKGMTNYEKEIIVYHKTLNNKTNKYKWFKVMGIIHGLPLLITLQQKVLSHKTMYRSLCNMVIPFVKDQLLKRNIYLIGNCICVEDILNAMINVCQLFVPNDVFLLVMRYFPKFSLPPRLPFVFTAHYKVMRSSYYHRKEIKNTKEKFDLKKLDGKDLYFSCNRHYQYYNWNSTKFRKVVKTKQMFADKIISSFDDIPYPKLSYPSRW